MYSEFDLKLSESTIRIPSYHSHLKLRPRVSVYIHINIYDDVAKHLSVSMHIHTYLYVDEYAYMYIIIHACLYLYSSFGKHMD